MPTTARPEVIVFDVNETLSDLAPMAQRFEDVGAPGHLAATWFAGVLRDGFALTAVGTTARFADLATAVLATVLHPVDLDRPLTDATQHVLAGFTELTVHPDVGPGVRALTADGLRLITLSNGAASVAQGLLARADLGDAFEATLSVEDAGVWKPAAGSYRWAAERCGVEPAAMMLVAVHPWDVDGAHRAGLQTAWVNRAGAPYPSTFTAPDLEVASLVELAERLRAA
ncbi:MAG: haloacid dehalogenase type II [Actinomycetota bacterium]